MSFGSYVIVFVIGLIAGLMLYHKFRRKNVTSIIPSEMPIETGIAIINAHGLSVDMKQPYKNIRQ